MHRLPLLLLLLLLLVLGRLVAVIHARSAGVYVAMFYYVNASYTVLPCAEDFV